MTDTPPAAHVGPDGHRARLKARFRDGGGTGLADYELLELLLTYALPRRDVKPLAKQLLTVFGSLEKTLTAPVEKLEAVKGMGEGSALLFRLAHTLATRAARQKMAGKIELVNRLELMDYLYTRYADKTREELHVLFVDAKLNLLADETIFTGTLTSNISAPRDIVKRALEHNAAGLIVAHNHPSGTPRPSEPDMAFTRALHELCPALGLTLHDHIIIGQGIHYSFKSAGLL